MKVVIYARVSTNEQEERNQLPAINEYCKRKGFEVLRSYYEKASAWKSGHQKELKKLIEDAGSGEFKAVVVWSLDRLTREGALRILQLYKKLSDYDVQILSVQEPWTEIPSEFRDAFISFIGSMAKFESQRRSERTKAGIARKKAEGHRVGRPPGAKDHKKRSTEGYKLRQARDRVKRYEETE